MQRDFTRKLLADLRALELLLDHGFLESGVRRIGVEQELFLVDRRWRPAPLAMEMIDRLADDHFTTEVARFNLEFNSDPLVFETDCLSRLERQLEALLARAREAAAELGIGLVMVGILPTLEKSDLTLANMTPKPRYFALNDAMRRLRGGDYEFHIKGLDELLVSHDSDGRGVQHELQTHFQVGRRSSRAHNLTSRSPRRCSRWHTTRRSSSGASGARPDRLFQQSVDHRAATPPARAGAARLLRTAVARRLGARDLPRGHRPLPGAARGGDRRVRPDPGNEIPNQGAAAPQQDDLPLGAPLLQDPRRPRPPADREPDPAGGPLLRDEMANAAFWYGLLAGASREYGDIRSRLEFDHAQENFPAAARLGLGPVHCRRRRPDRRKAGARRALPLAREGCA